MRILKIYISLFYVAILFVLGVATFLEIIQGTNWTHRHIYGSWWFITLWGLLVIAGIIYFIKIHECRKIVIAIHSALILILIGSLVSHFTGRNGTIHLRLDHPQNIVEIEHNGQRYLHRLAYDVTLSNFEIQTDKEGNPIDFRSEFVINGEPGLVSMNRIFRYGNLRLYQASFDDDLQGSTLIINRDPYGIPITYTGYILLFASLIYLCLKRCISPKIWLICIVLTLLWCLYYFVLDGTWMYIPVLRSPLLFIHVLIIIMAYMLLLVQAVLSAKWLLGRHQDRVRISPNSRAMLRLSICLLALGIFLGAVWANLSWGNYWSWDPKEVWALITFMIYAIPVHSKSLPIFNHSNIYHKYMFFAFFVVIMTYLGVNYFLPGFHSYV